MRPSSQMTSRPRNVPLPITRTTFGSGGHGDCLRKENG